MLRVLGPYILVLGCYELLLFALPLGWAWLLEPRLALAEIGAHQLVRHLTAISIASGAWHIFLGSTFLARRPLLKTYLISEFVLCLPSFVFCVMLWFFNGGHPFGGLYPILFYVLLCVESVVPMALAVGCLVIRRWPDLAVRAGAERSSASI